MSSHDDDGRVPEGWWSRGLGTASCVGWFLAAAILTGSNADAQGKKQRQPAAEEHEARIRRLLNACDYTTSRLELESLGSSANGVYAEILKDDTSGSLAITRVLGLVERQSGDRTEFLHL